MRFYLKFSCLVYLNNALVDYQKTFKSEFIYILMKKGINRHVIREHIIDKFQREEKKIDELKNDMALETGKLQISRPKGFSKDIESKSLNFESIKKNIKDNLKKIKIINPGWSDNGRVPTGIPGLDDIMGGGLRRNSVNIVGGGAGTGKSIFAMEFLAHGIECHNENGVYISFEESEEKILNDFKDFNWNLRDKIEKKQLVILNYTPEQVNKVLESGGGIIRDTIENINARRLVIDSVSAFTLLYDRELERRKALLQLFESINKWSITAILVSEQEEDPDKHQTNTIEFEVDGVVLLYNIRKGDIRERSIEVYKMRATQHAGRIFPMRIDSTGITIYSEETVF